MLGFLLGPLCPSLSEILTGDGDGDGGGDGDGDGDGGGNLKVNAVIASPRPEANPVNGLLAPRTDPSRRLNAPCVQC